MKKPLLTLLLSIFVLSCSLDNPSPYNTIIESTLIAKGNLYGDGGEKITNQNLIISNQTDWDALITQLDSVNNVSDYFTETDINFSEDMIIAIFDEKKPTAGHSIELDIRSNSENIMVEVTKTEPGDLAATVITQPFHIVKISKTDLPILLFE